MAIALNDAHRELSAVARSFLAGQKARESARALLDAPDEALPPFWSALADLGWLGLHLPEEYGGSGYGLSELAVILEEIGRAVAPGPFLTTVTASAIVADLADPATKARLLPGLGDGTTVAGVGLSGSVAVQNGVATGDAGVVLGAGLADLLVLLAGDDVLLLPVDRAGLVVTRATNLDLTRRAARVQLDGVVVEDGEHLPNGRRRAVDVARTLAAAEAAGGARECVQMASDYAKVREQFGRVIATFGPVKHHCANMLVAAEMATAAVWDAARVAAGDPRQFSLASAIAATAAMPAYLGNAQLNIQVHGGIGFTWEHDGHMLLRRAAALAALFPAEEAARDVTRLTDDGVRRNRQVELPPEAEEVRAEIRGILGEIAALPAGEQRARLVETGLAMPHWPRPWGREAKAVEQLVVDQELRRAGIERPNYGITGWVLLTLIQKASADQVARWVGPTLQGELVWCQLFSEPNAGSDAAGIRTRGTRVEGGWLVNGQKVWTSGAQYCHRGLATVRTDPEAAKHAGITTMVVDMKGAGVEVRPLREASGGAMFNEVFFDDVFVPDDDVVGPVGGGWTVARSTLGNERVSIGGGGLGAGIDLIALYRRTGSRLPEAASIVGRLLAEEAGMAALNMRQVERAVVGGEPGPEGNVTKLLSAEHAQRVADAGLTLLGPAAALADGDGVAVGAALIFTRALSIAGGTSEITRNQIAERILGLPRDPLIR
jgi:alkylation response protein AidB-like acyl-CoA dehydrogenase